MKAIVLYAATAASPESNWLSKVGPTSGVVRYVYSFYFATTTILTVGYGDLLPTTPFEVAVVVLVQIFGTVRLIKASRCWGTSSTRSATASPPCGRGARPSSATWAQSKS